MGDRTGIEWTDASWNPVTGCTKVSPGCDNCYAATLAERFRGTPGHYYEQGFDVVLRPDKLDQPLRWTRPRRIFVNSMSDLFHDAIPDEYIARVWAVMAAAPQHTFQVLTKRHGRMRSLLSSDLFQDLIGRAQVDDPRLTKAAWNVEWPLANVWLGVSAEDQKWADLRIPALLGTPAAVRWVSAEPLLGPITLSRRHLWPYPAAGDGWTRGLDWVVAGGESGTFARPMHPQWARDLRDQCERARVPFLFKQWGQWAPVNGGGVRLRDVCLSEDGTRYNVGRDYVCAPNESDGEWLRRVGKKAAGRELDGRTHDGYPQEVRV